MKLRRRRAPKPTPAPPAVSEELAVLIDRTRQAVTGLNDLNQRILDREVSMMRSLIAPAGGQKNDEQPAT